MADDLDFRAEIERVATENAQVRAVAARWLAALDRRDWERRELYAIAGAVPVYFGDMDQCGYCLAIKSRGDTHAPDCIVERARALLGEAQTPTKADN